MTAHAWDRLPPAGARSGLPNREMAGAALAVVAQSTFFLGLVFVALSFRRMAPEWPPVDQAALPLGLAVGGRVLAVASPLLVADTLALLGAAALAALAARWATRADNDRLAGESVPGAAGTSTEAQPEGRAGERAAARPVSHGAARSALVASLILGGAFLAGQTLELTRLGAVLGRDAGYGMLFATLAGLHGAHAAVGLLLLAASAWRPGAAGPTLVRITALYWAFVAAVWLALLAVLTVAA